MSQGSFSVTDVFTVKGEIKRIIVFEGVKDCCFCRSKSENKI